MASTGLKMPCFCGSGKKYEDCCFLRDMEELGGRGRSSTASWLKVATGGRSFNSLQEAQETVNRVVNERNNTPLDDFCGLSPAQMTRLLYDPFGEENPARYNLELTTFPETPILDGFEIYTLSSKGILREVLVWRFIKTHFFR